MTSYLEIATFQEKAVWVLWFFETESFIKTQHCYSTQYGKDAPSDNANWRWLNQFHETGDVLHRKEVGIPST